MRRSKFALGICLILSVAVGLSGLSSCGGGGSSRPVTKPGDEVIITPPGNRAPVVSRAFENIVLPFAPGSEWESEPLANYFSDPDDDTLRFSADTDSSQVASVELSDTGLLIVRAQGSGAATITVNATDPGGLSVAQSFTVTTTLDNRPPTAARTFDDIALTLSDDDSSSGRWASGYLDAYFSDPESARLSYEWRSSDESIAVVSADDGLLPPAGTSAGTPLGLVVDAKGAGITTVSVTAADPHGATATQRFSIVVADSRGVVGPPPDDQSDTPAGAARIASGETVRGDLHSPDDEDWFRLEITEPSAVDIQLLAAPGTEISVLDLDGNVLASRVAPGVADRASGGQGGLTSLRGELLVSPRWGPLAVVGFGLVVYRTVIVVVRVGSKLKPLLSRAVPYVLGASLASITVGIIQIGRDVSVRAGGKFSVNLLEYFSCRRAREDNNVELTLKEPCNLEIESMGWAHISFKKVNVASFRIEDNVLVGNAECKATGVSYETDIKVKITDIGLFGYELKKSITESGEITLNMKKSDEDKCRPQPTPDSPKLSVSASPGKSVSIKLNDYIRDPRDGRLTFTPAGIPSKVTVDNNGSNWTIRISPDAELGEHLMTITATSEKDETPEILSANFPFQISIVCHAQVMFNDHDRWTPSQSFMSALILSKYTGDCRNGRANGQGTFDATSGLGQSLSYVGQWEDGEPRGQGEWHINMILSERHYEGEWQDRRPHGLGTGSIEYAYGDIQRYTGEWVDGLPHGQGIWTALTDGDRYRYIGEFRNGLQHGRGVETNNYGNGDRERLEGEFRNDVLWNGTSTWNGVSCRVVSGVWC